MTPEQLKALQDQLRAAESTNAADSREIALLKEQIAAGEKALQESRAALAQRDEELKTRASKIELLSAEVERLHTSKAAPAPGAKRTLDDAIRAHMPSLQEPEPVAFVLASMRGGPTP